MTQPKSSDILSPGDKVRSCFCFKLSLIKYRKNVLIKPAGGWTQDSNKKFTIGSDIVNLQLSLSWGAT